MQRSVFCLRMVASVDPEIVGEGDRSMNTQKHIIYSIAFNEFSLVVLLLAEL